MTTVHFRWEVKPSGIADLVSGGIEREIDRRATLVLNGAKRRCPVDSGRLRASLTKEITMEGGRKWANQTGSGVSGGVPVARVGTNLKYATYVHEGTGIYGPKHTPIVPRNGRFLVFTPRGSSVTVFARSVRGVPPRPFLREALEDAR